MSVDPTTSDREQELATQQGMSMQGMSMQGMSMQGMTLRGFRIHGASMDGHPLAQVRIERGELVAKLRSTELRGRDLLGARLRGEAGTATSKRVAVVEYQITSVEPEDPAHDPTGTGATYLYGLDQYVPDTDSWSPACGLDADGRRAAIPLDAVWDDHGDRSDGGSMFTFACTTGVLAKCYRWGYRPWLTGYGDAIDLHQTCTRLARADYCGDGTPHTYDGTWIDIWDSLPAPGPIQSPGSEPTGMSFEGAWTSTGAACVAHARWSELGTTCADRTVPVPCGSLSEALKLDPTVQLFNASTVQ